MTRDSAAAVPDRTPDFDRLHPYLSALLDATPAHVRIAADPVAFPHRYSDASDIEIAAVVAGLLAFGRVAAFRPILDTLFTAFDEAGGPRCYIAQFDERRHASLRPIVYRWNRGIDFILLFATLRELLERKPTLGAYFPCRDSARETLTAAISAWRDTAVALAPRLGIPAVEFGELPRGFRYFLPSPEDGSACKRWNMILRWLVRSEDGVDFGIWTHLSASQLVLPLDTHTGRIGRMLGLTARNDDSWRTAEEITTHLRNLDPDDPVRFDFALAHLGISGGCKSRYIPSICDACALRPVCTSVPPIDRVPDVLGERP